ncbi:glycoside hydrolase superfamily [Pelagophyceae sp. CCMP2097]|nr:glycoside hydrolase superfamily [Pelagophyceae sp. CCMP2097]
MRIAALFVVLWCGAAQNPSGGAAHNQAGEGPAVAAYLPEWRYEGANWDEICRRVSHLILFSAEVGPDGALAALDRIPRRPLLAEARAAAARHGTRLLLCFGGNGRSAGFAGMVADSASRATFVKKLVALLAERGLDGVDYNWEYPGYIMGRGYADDSTTRREYAGLAALVRETRRAFDESPRPLALTLAYYPDGKQEVLLAASGVADDADLLHAMSYDAPGGQHSPMSLAEAAVARAVSARLPLHKCTLGLPFYARDARSGDWTTYEDMVQRHHPLGPTADQVFVDGSALGFNGVSTIEAKTKMALKAGLAGVMIWEVGQDCRLRPTVHGKTTHVQTCPSDESSLLVAVQRAIDAAPRSAQDATASQRSAPDL